MGTPKKRIVSFVKKRFKKLGYKPSKYVLGSIRNKTIDYEPLDRFEKPSLETQIEQVQQMRATPAEYELYRLSKDALLNIARQANIIGYRKMRKDELIQSIAALPPQPNLNEAISTELERKLSPPGLTGPTGSLEKYSKSQLNKLAKELGIKPIKDRQLLIQQIKDIQNGKPPSDIDISEPIINQRRRSTIPREFNRSKPPLEEVKKPDQDSGRVDDQSSPSPSDPNSDAYNESIRRQALLNRQRQEEDQTRLNELKRQQEEAGIDLSSDKGRFSDNSEGTFGDGKNATLSKKMTDKGISNFDIDDMLKPFPEYLGCISSDELITKILPQIQPQSRAFWVSNLDTSKQKGSHWVSFFIDARPEGGSNSIEYFDSFGEPIPDRMRKDLQEIANKLNAEKYLKLKENTLVQRQDDDSSNCGFFAVKFILDRMRGKSFAESTGFDSNIKDESVGGEKDISKFKTQMGWGFIPSFMRRPDSFADQIKNFIFFPSKELSVPFKNFMAKYGEYAITNAKIRRQPISWAIDKLLNVISLGTWSAGKKELNYPDLFHLGIVLELRRGGDTKNVVLEKLERPHFTESWKDDSNVEYYPVVLKQPSGKRAFPSLNEFIQKTIDKIGIGNFVIYGGMRGINCQNFIMDLLNANNSLTPGAKAFIYQPIEELVKKMPFWVSRISQGVTDFSARSRQFFGVGKSPNGMRSKTSATRANPRLDALLKNFQK